MRRPLQRKVRLRTCWNCLLQLPEVAFHYKANEIIEAAIERLDKAPEKFEATFIDAKSRCTVDGKFNAKSGLESKIRNTCRINRTTDSYCCLRYSLDLWRLRCEVAWRNWRRILLLSHVLLAATLKNKLKLNWSSQANWLSIFQRHDWVGRGIFFMHPRWYQRWPRRRHFLKA